MGLQCRRTLKKRREAMKREKKDGMKGGEARLVSEEGPDAELEEDEEEGDKVGEGEPENGDGAGAGAGRPKISSGSNTSSMAKILQGTALSRVLMMVALLHPVRISTVPTTSVILNWYRPPPLKVANVLVTFCEVCCREARGCQLLRAWYSTKLIFCWSVRFFNSVEAGGVLKALFVGANMVMPVCVSLACAWNFWSTLVWIKRLTKVENSPADTNT